MVSMSQGKMENAALPKRFYERAAFDPVDAGYIITLDGKHVKTPARNLLQVKQLDLAAAIAAEWDAQREVIHPDKMPLTRLMHIALDRVPQDRGALLQDIARYAETDLLCYRVPVGGGTHALDPDNASLRQKQDAAFDPILTWVEQQFAAPFTTTDGVLPVEQSPASVAAIAAVFAAANDHQLAALAMMVPLVGSALLTLAVWKSFLGVEEALVAARLDENAQAERWGEDLEVTRAWEVKANDIRACAFFLTHN